jgi:endonuclease-8
MPEGHTIHRAARVQTALLAGGRIHADSPQGRFADGAGLLDGLRLDAIEAYGKHLFYAFEGGLWLHVHLGLFGRFRMGTGIAPDPRGAVRLRLFGEAGWIALSGPTACTIVDAHERRRFLARLGPDPLRPDARPARAVERILKSATPLGALLLDQSVIAGVGNVYRAELAFRARISPIVPGRALDRQTVLRIWRDARGLMRDGERSGRIVTTQPRDRPHPAGAVRHGERHYVYHRTGKACFICTTPIVSSPLAGRAVYFCPHCQPAPISSSRKIAGMRPRKSEKPRVAAGQATAS